MAVSCPGCGREIDSNGLTPDSAVACPACGHIFPLCVPVAAAEAQEDKPSAEVPAGVVICPVCKTSNPAAAKVCMRCAAILRRKHWPRLESAPSGASAARFPVKRKRLITLVMCLLGIALVAGTAWMGASLFRGVETPALTCRRMAGMAANGDWGRYYDRLHSSAQQALAARLRVDPRTAGLQDKEAFVARMKTDAAAPSDLRLPCVGVVVEKERVREDSAWVEVKTPGGGRKTILMAKQSGVWKAMLRGS